MPVHVVNAGWYNLKDDIIVTVSGEVGGVLAPAARESDDKHGVLFGVHLHQRAVPDGRTPLADGHLLHDRAGRQRVGAADAAVGWSV